MGPLTGVRVIEMAGIGPAPYCGMLLADMGAQVLRVDRLSDSGLGLPVAREFDLLNRGKRAVAVDLKAAEGVALVKSLAADADILIEGFRPGVMERLGLGPQALESVNPRLVFGRMTGYGQDGPLAARAGHDINYIAVAGALDAIGPADGPPVPPLNLVGDFGGGALFLAMGCLAAMHEAKASGRGQVVDAAMIDGVASLLTMAHSFRHAGISREARGANTLDGGAPYYACYETADARHVAVGAIERKFWLELLDRLGLDEASLPRRDDPAQWPALRQRLAAVFASRTRDEWEAVFSASDACVSPVLSLGECLTHPLGAARAMYVEEDGVAAPAPTPRFSRTPGATQGPPRTPRVDGRSALADWGVAEARIDALLAAGVVAGD